jgi:hypothetical protein
MLRILIGLANLNSFSACVGAASTDYPQQAQQAQSAGFSDMSGMPVSDS